MEKKEEETREAQMKSPSPKIDRDDEPEINYRGLKVMPFVIGNSLMNQKCKYKFS